MNPLTVGDLLAFLSNYPLDTEVVVEGTPTHIAYAGVARLIGPCGDEDRAQRAVMLVAYIDMDDLPLTRENTDA